MRRVAVGLVSLGIVVGACTRAPTPTDGATASIPPDPAPSAPEQSIPPPPVELAKAPLPAGPVVTASTEQAHGQAQARLLRGKRLPALQPAGDRSDRSVSVGLLADAERLDVERDVQLEVQPDAEPDAESDAQSNAESDAQLGDGTVEPPPMPGVFVPIADPAQSEALASFHAALAALQQRRDPDGKVRVAMYGASGTAADLAVGYVRTYLQARFGDGGPGFVPLVPLSRWYRHNEVVVRAAKGWRKEHAQVRKGRHDGHYGLLGASFSATAGKRWARIEPKKSSRSCEGIGHVELFFLRQPGGGSFRVWLDGDPAQTVSTHADAFEPGYHVIDVAPGAHTVHVETVDDAEVRVFGAVLERPDPGVVVDVLGIDGTRSSNMLTWNEALWADNLRRRAPDLYTLSYGTNESVDDELSIPLYAEDLRAELRRFAQALPDASCLLLGPVDFPILEDGQVRPRPVLREIIEVQRQVAVEEGCGFWDGIAFMGGELSMSTWVQSQPPLARADHLHFTKWGAARKGMALADALMHAFDARVNTPSVEAPSAALP
ncbi:MAG: GDSL-type esterase/lipase family protein [Myxococcota bacterium]